MAENPWDSVGAGRCDQPSGWGRVGEGAGSPGGLAKVGVQRAQRLESRSPALISCHHS